LCHLSQKKKRQPQHILQRWGVHRPSCITLLLFIISSPSLGGNSYMKNDYYQVENLLHATSECGSVRSFNHALNPWKRCSTSST
jgi:hypothetical protein